MQGAFFFPVKSLIRTFDAVLFAKCNSPEAQSKAKKQKAAGTLSAA